MGVSQNYGYLFGGPNIKDHSVLRSTLGSLYFGELPSTMCTAMQEFEKFAPDVDETLESIKLQNL